MANVSWEMRHYHRVGTALTTNYSDYSSGSGTTNEILHATNRSMTFSLNSFDTLNFGLYLDNPMASEIVRMRSYVKVWRTVRDDNGSILYQDPSNQPCFVGVVGQAEKSGQANLMSVTAYSVLWILKFRFHVNNHYLKKNPATGALYKQSALMWKMIDLNNDAFNFVDPIGTGIAQGNFLWSGEPTVAPFFVPRGSYLWANIMETIMSRAGGVDIIPRYYHDEGNPIVMYFDTDQKRGIDRSASLNFRYHTGTNDNLDDLVEDVQAVPGEFGNYVWAVGQGGPNSGKLALARHDGGVGTDGIAEIGGRMVRKDYPDEQRLGVSGPPPTHLRAHAESDLMIAKIPQTRYTLSIGEGSPYWYGSHFLVGDVMRLDADRGALQVDNVKQRIYECTLSISDLNIEKAEPTIANDFYGKVAT